MSLSTDANNVVRANALSSTEGKAPEEIWIELRDTTGRLWAKLELTRWQLEVQRNREGAIFDLRPYLLGEWQARWLHNQDLSKLTFR